MLDTDQELVDIITPDNQVIGTKLKVEAHKDGDLHRIVIAELINDKGEYCFVRQASNRQDAGQYVSPIGGHVSAGEEVESALIRESEEEVGITPVAYEYIGSTIYHRQVIGRDENHLFLVYNVFTDQTPVLNHESVEFRWFSLDEIKKTLRDDPAIFGDAWHQVFKNLFPTIYDPQSTI